MVRLLKYLNPYLGLLMLAIFLLFIQANADLALPDYLSRIVTNGIQLNGIEEVLPRALREQQFQKLTLFLNKEEQNQLLTLYEKVNPQSPNFEQLRSLYPISSETALYVLKSPLTEQQVQESLSFQKAFLTVFLIDQWQSGKLPPSNMLPSQGAELFQIPPGMDWSTVLSKIPLSTRQQIADRLYDRLSALGENVLRQNLSMAVRDEYLALGVNIPRLQSAYIQRTGLQMLGIAFLSALCTVTVGLLAARTAAGFSRDLRHLLYSKVLSFSSLEFDRFSAASLITRSTNDINQLQMLIMMMVRMVFYAPLIAIGGLIRAMSKDVSMVWTIGLAVITLVGVIFVAYQVSIKKFKLIQGLVDRLNAVARENLVGMMVIRAFNRQDYEEQRFDEVNLHLMKENLFVNRVFIVVMPFMMLIMNGVSLLIIGVGAQQVAQASLQVGDLMAFMQYAMQIVFSFMMISFMFMAFPRADVSAHRVADVLESEISITDPAQPLNLPKPVRGEIAFHNVSFRYPDAEEDVLHEIDFVAPPGTTTAILGTTGSGKSTILNLIPRFYDVTEGKITLDGVDIRQIPLHQLREQIAYVPQKSNLFSGDVENNLRFADEEADAEHLIEALKIAQAQDFVLGSEQGLKLEVSQGGTNLSGGQRQRLAIARALVKNAPIYIFDDSFSALDFKTDLALRKELKKRLANATVFIVSQRVASIKDADQILVLDQGRIVGKGTHAELMQSCEVYREIAISQLGVEVTA
ncbi:MAG: ABC transporter [Anaerolineae bacterium]|jgi:ATP-binding cassette subfamily B protein|nr:MAG: ABC transporter [Anaerolineae bacterium]